MFAWMGQKFDQHRAIGTIMILVLLVVPGWLANASNASADRAREQQEDIDDGFVSCLRGNDTRTVLADVVRIAYDSGGTLDFTRVPSFVNLDTETQQFFIDLRDLAANRPDPASNPESSRNRALAKLTLRDCEDEFPTHTPGLTIESPPAQGPP